jgi:23S rRNA (uridine2552-2'-O)-methyltransferase
LGLHDVKKKQGKNSDRLGLHGGTRQETVRLKTAKGRTVSSQRWLQRQLNDPYVAEANRLGYRSRSAFKLAQLDDRFDFLRPGLRVVDLGAAPGGWTQVTIELMSRKSELSGRVVGLDILEMEPIAGADLILGDFMTHEGLATLREHVGETCDVVLSDMAAPTTGHGPTDHLRTSALCEAAFEFAEEVLAPGGHFIAKVFKGGTERDLLNRMKQVFQAVRHAKPPASRAESPETYVVAMGYRGNSRPADKLDGTD